MTRAPRTQTRSTPLVAAATGGQTTRRPVWFMRQAGRSLPEYRAVRADRGMLECCFDTETIVELTLQPVRRHHVDAAILFSDIVVPLRAAGVGLEIVAGTGPVIASPVRTRDDVHDLPALDRASVGAIEAAVTELARELSDTDVALIGFAGAPFTLASYLIEGGPSRTYQRTKALMREDPSTWNDLMGRLTNITVEFLRVQLDAGVDAVQLFDSWAGALSDAEYRTYVLPHSARVFAEVADYGAPRIHFGVGTGELLTAMADAGPEVLGVDWRVPLATAVSRVNRPVALQGNLDPTVLFAGETVVDREVARVIDDADAAIAAGAVGHIFNLGHGVLPDTDPGVLTHVVELVHSM
ncbi:uroporphyrinogen decarboxylase [Gordonia jinhuaensis]|uniref:uroporphyrinogen decarboxylase n=1 Tax=Gordonia jinhuaensis TaxID=1517702 RepID=UPI00166948C4|nr:uroporphyrinogen decarboxylase [Gordonia jinhuaensis]